MPKRWSIVLKMETSVDGQTWTVEGQPYEAFSDVYGDNEKKVVEDKKNRIKDKAEKEK